MNVIARYGNLSQYQNTLTTGQKSDVLGFSTLWKTRGGRFMSVAERIGQSFPPELIAAIAWRECDHPDRFNEYLHNGDPMTDANGKPIPTTDAPTGVLFTSWDDAAVDAITREKGAITASTGLVGLQRMCVYAECYNGLGYAERGVPSPYVLAGTSGYQHGKFNSDGHYDADLVDAQVGILPLLRAIIP